MKGVILAGGKGKRLGDITSSVPKPMVYIAGKPILQHQIQKIQQQGISELLILLGYKGNIIKEYFGNGSKWGLRISYHQDPFPLGTAGALKNIEHLLDDDFIVFYGDTIFEINLAQIITYHKKTNGYATLLVHPNDHPQDSDLLDIAKDNRITNFYSKPHLQNTYHRNLVNAGLYVLSTEIFKHIEKDKYSDFGKDIFPRLIKNKLNVYAYNTTEYIKDIGTYKRLKEVERDLIVGKLKNTSKLKKQKAIYLDRDGVINKENYPLNNVKKFHLYPNVENAINIINKSDYLAVLVTNQPIVAKGMCTVDELKGIHNYMEYLLGQDGAYLDRIYFCPHHEEVGHEGEVKKFKIKCNCRKPKIGMIEQSVNDLNIDVNQSFIIGDRTVDIMTGINAHLSTILLNLGHKGEDNKFNCTSQFVFNDLLEAVKFIIHRKDYNQEPHFK